MRAFREMTKRLCLSQGGWPVLQPGRKGAKRRPHVSRSSWPQGPGTPALTAPRTLGEAVPALPQHGRPGVSRWAGQSTPWGPAHPCSSSTAQLGAEGAEGPRQEQTDSGNRERSRDPPGEPGPRPLGPCSVPS